MQGVRRCARPRPAGLPHLLRSVPWTDHSPLPSLGRRPRQRLQRMNGDDRNVARGIVTRRPQNGHGSSCLLPRLRLIGARRGPGRSAQTYVSGLVCDADVFFWVLEAFAHSFHYLTWPLAVPVGGRERQRRQRCPFAGTPRAFPPEPRYAVCGGLRCLAAGSHFSGGEQGGHQQQDREWLMVAPACRYRPSCCSGIWTAANSRSNRGLEVGGEPNPIGGYMSRGS